MCACACVCMRVLACVSLCVCVCVYIVRENVYSIFAHGFLFIKMVRVPAGNCLFCDWTKHELAARTACVFRCTAQVPVSQVASYRC